MPSPTRRAAAGTGGNAGSWALSKTGAGTLVLGGTNTYTGGTNVTGGTLSISADANLGTGGTVALGDGTGITFTAGGTYSHDITVAGDPAFDVGTGLTVTQSGAIADGATPGEVEKTGGGVLVLSAANSYSGGTVIAGGTLRVGNDSALGTGAVNLTASGTRARPQRSYGRDRRALGRGGQPGAVRQRQRSRASMWRPGRPGASPAIWWTTAASSTSS